jgi:hypothetical protein
MSLDNVHKQMLQILEDKKTLTNMQLEYKWANFMKEYPLIFLSLQKENPDLNMLSKMFDKLKQVRSGDKDHDTAEKEFGDIMANKYIYTKFAKPSKEELDIAYQKALKNRENSSF